jgi:lipase maturation factor 1
VDAVVGAIRSVVDAVESGARWLVGATPGGSTYVVTKWVFLRTLGVIYLIAFASFWVQLKGLIGPHGILPAYDFLQLVRQSTGPERYRLAPTLFWLRADGTALALGCALGVVCSLLVVVNVWPTANLLLCWALYLSLATVGGTFMAYQWDVLLLETGLLALLFAPRGTAPALTLFLLWWLLFRLTFESGIVKLNSGDPTWRNLTALDFHFWTQPLPTWTAWYANLLPAWCKKGMVLATYLFEIGFPFMIFGPRPLRLIGVVGIVFFQLTILATGNYNFFNLLTIALALLVVDDVLWTRILPARLQRFVPEGTAPPSLPVAAVVMVVGLFTFTLATAKLWSTVFHRRSPPAWLVRPIVWTEPFRSINSYGLFRVMTTERPEIVIEGSDDGLLWKAYEFRWKPGDLARRPRFVEPHQPRLDWQMWFAALSSYEYVPWFRAFLAKLLEGSPDVLKLLRSNPFRDRPPRYVRALLFQYRFTTAAERDATGAWWSRQLVGPYSPTLSLAR